MSVPVAWVGRARRGLVLAMESPVCTELHMGPEDWEAMAWLCTGSALRYPANLHIVSGGSGVIVVPLE